MKALQELWAACFSEVLCDMWSCFHFFLTDVFFLSFFSFYTKSVNYCLFLLRITLNETQIGTNRLEFKEILGFPDLNSVIKRAFRVPAVVVPSYLGLPWDNTTKPLQRNIGPILGFLFRCN